MNISLDLQMEPSESAHTLSKEWLDMMDPDVTDNNFSVGNFTLLYRKTVLAVLSRDWKDVPLHMKKRLHGSLNTFSVKMKNYVWNCSSTILHLKRLVVDPWGKTDIELQALLRGDLNIEDDVKKYIHSEIDEIVLGRIHFLVRMNCKDYAMCLAKQFYMHKNRLRMNYLATIQGTPGNKKDESPGIADKNKKFNAALQWMMALLKMKKSLAEIIAEIRCFSCHDGLPLIFGFQRQHTKFLIVSRELIKFFLLRDITSPKDSHCTMVLLKLFADSMKGVDLSTVISSVKEVMAHGTTSGHFYLCADVFYSRFEESLLPLCLELIIRGFTVDINHLEVSRNLNDLVKMEELKTHVAEMFDKVSTLFSKHVVVQRECILSAFILRPTQQRLQKLNDFTREIFFDTSFIDRVAHENRSPPFIDSIITEGIPNLSQQLLVDFISILESARHNMFTRKYSEWNGNELEKYLEAYKRSSDGSRKECASNQSDLLVPQPNENGNSEQALLPVDGLQSSHPVPLLNVTSQVQEISKTNLLQTGQHFPHDPVKNKHFFQPPIADQSSSASEVFSPNQNKNNQEHCERMSVIQHTIDGQITIFHHIRGSPLH